MSTDRTDQYPEVSGDEAALVPPQESPKQEWPKKIRTLTASELDRLTIDGLGRFYWDGKLVNYEGHSSRLEQKPVDLDRSAMELLDRTARELADPNTVQSEPPTEPQVEPQAEPASVTNQPEAPAAASPHQIAVPVAAHIPAAVPVIEARRDEVVRSVEVPTLMHPYKGRLSLSGWQSLGAILALLGFLIGAAGLAAQGWVAASEWGCRVGMISNYCPPPPPEPKPPARPDIPA